MSENPSIDESVDQLYESLKNHFWVDGGFLQSIGVATNPDIIHIYLARKLHSYEEKLIPDEINGFPVVTKVIGRITIC